MSTEAKPAEAVTLPKIRLEVRGDKLYIWPNKKHPGSPVVVDALRLERWASRLYREGLFV